MEAPRRSDGIEDALVVYFANATSPDGNTPALEEPDARSPAWGVLLLAFVAQSFCRQRISDSATRLSVANRRLRLVTRTYCCLDENGQLCLVEVLFQETKTEAAT